MTVIERHKNGELVGYFGVVNYRGFDGKRLQIRKNGDGRTLAAEKSSARKLEREFLNKRDRLELPGQTAPTPKAEPKPILTVGSYLTAWLGTRQGLAPATLTRYRELLAHAIGRIGDTPLDQLDALEVDALYASIRAAGRSPKTALNVHRVLKQAIGDAAKKRIIAWNPVDAASSPRPVKFQYYVISKDELARVLVGADQTPIGPLARVAAWTGLRLGELLALRWADVDLVAVDLVAGRLTVNQSINSAGIIGTPKTTRSRRTISLARQTVATLRLVRRRQAKDRKQAGPAYATNDYVFGDALGRARTQSSVDHVWRRVATNAGISRARFHDLRHTHASHLIADGWPIPVVAERLGHSHTSTTLNVYAHALPGQDGKLAQSLDRIFGTAQ